MTIALAALVFLSDIRAPWSVDWVWGCPLIVITVIFHVLGLGFISSKAIQFHADLREPRRATVGSALVVGAMTLLATCLHGIEAGIWAAAYCLNGALPDFKDAMLYSLGALTTYGHRNLYLEDRWRLMGPIEALDGWLLFGLSTAFLFWLIQEVSPHNRNRH
jgi:hypothetical protein